MTAVTKQPASHPPHISISRWQLFFIALLVAGLYVLLPQLGSFKHSLPLLATAQWGWIAAAILGVGITYLAAAGCYVALAWRGLSYSTTCIVQLASMFINRLLPAGVGALGANFLYLRHTRHSKAQAAGVVAVNNVLGFLAHCLIFITVLIIQPDLLFNFVQTRLRHQLTAIVLEVLVVLVVIVSVSAVVAYRRSVVFTKWLTPLKGYAAHPHKLLFGLLFACILTLANIFCLTWTLRALGLHFDFVASLLVFTAALVGGTVVPTPGGLGGLEAALFGALLATHVSSSVALSAVLLYRLISYWLPLLIGGAAYWWSSRQQYFKPLSRGY